MHRTKRTNRRPSAPESAIVRAAMIVTLGAMTAMPGCGFDSVSIGFADPNPDDNFGQFVPPSERPTWEVEVWQRPPEEDEDPQGADQPDKPEDPDADPPTTDDAEG